MRKSPPFVCLLKHICTDVFSAFLLQEDDALPQLSQEEKAKYVHFWQRFKSSSFSDSVPKHPPPRKPSAPSNEEIAAALASGDMDRVEQLRKRLQEWVIHQKAAVEAPAPTAAPSKAVPLTAAARATSTDAAPVKAPLAAAARETGPLHAAALATSTEAASLKAPVAAAAGHPGPLPSAAPASSTETAPFKAPVAATPCETGPLPPAPAAVTSTTAAPAEAPVAAAAGETGVKPATNLGRTGVCLACRKFFLEGETDTCNSCERVLLWFPVPTGKAAACEPPVLKKAKAAPPAADSAAADQQPLFAPTSSTMFFPREPDVTPTPDAGPPSKPLPSAATLEAAGAALPVPLPANTGAPQPAAEATAAPPLAADAEAAVAPLPGTPGSTTTESSPGPTALPAAPSSVPSATLPDLSKASPDEIAAVLKLLSSKMQNLSAAPVNEAGPGAPEVPPVLAAPALAPAPAAAPWQTPLN